MRKFLITLLILSLLMVCVAPCYSQGGRDYQARVLTVSKWISLSGRFFNLMVTSFTDGDTTPSVYTNNVFKTANTGATTITTFDNSVTGQPITILFGDSDTTIDFSGTNLKGNGGVDWTASQYDVLTGVYDGTNWYCEVSSPSVISSGDLTITGSITIGVGTKHDGYVIRDAAEVQTIDATADVTLDTLTLEDENGYLIKAHVVARQSDGTTGIYFLTVGAKRVSAGSAALVGTVVSLNTAEDEASWACTFTVSGNNLLLSVTGEGGTTIEWGGTMSYINMSN